jgi:hypothetical protein
VGKRKSEAAIFLSDKKKVRYRTAFCKIIDRNSATAIYAATITPSPFFPIGRPGLGLHIARMPPTSTTLTTKVESGSPYQLNKEQVSNFAPRALQPQSNSKSGIKSLQSSPCTHQLYIPRNHRLKRQEESPRWS